MHPSMHLADYILWLKWFMGFVWSCGCVCTCALTCACEMGFIWSQLAHCLHVQLHFRCGV